jgi:Soluble lytic murein transglycosylase and related regulatory proteins (some contain LysM/invasin domains)
MEQTPQQRAMYKLLYKYKRLMMYVTANIPSSLAHRKRVRSRKWSAGQALLLIFTVILLFSTFMMPHQQRNAFANVTIPEGYACSWHQVAAGDTLSALSIYYQTNTKMITRANHIHNPDIIFTGQHLCIPHATARHASYNRHHGILSNGSVRWYAYDALDHSNHKQVVRLLRQAAARHRLPYDLLLAIAWQESGWRQHVIAHDGGIGAMQLMPYTAQSLNRMVHRHYDPYKLADNIELGAIYLRTLHHNFHGNMTKVISAYNEGGWNVVHRGVFNWRYVYSVRALMYRY